MTTQQVTLRTVLFADLVGFSRLAAEDQTATFQFMNRCYQFASRQATERDGEMIKTMGDGFLLVFERPTAAVIFALGFHRFVAKNRALHKRPYIFRMGIHMGEVQRAGNDVFGHVVNVASRLEGKAEPGHTLISIDVFRQVSTAINCQFEAKGSPVLKNIREPIATFKVIDERRQSDTPSKGELKIEVINKFSLQDTNGRLELPDSQAARALLGCLALSRDLGETQRRLSALLWPSLSAEDAAEELKKAWNDLSAVLNDEDGSRVTFVDDRIELNVREVSVDLPKLLDRLGVGDVDDLLVEGVEWSDALAPSIDAFNDVIASWADVTRSRWRDIFANAMESNLDRFQPTDSGVRPLATALLKIEPGHELASGKLMAHYAAVGNRAAAMREFQRLQSYLEKTFGIEPSDEIKSVLRTIQDKPGSSAEPAVRPSPPSTPPKADPKPSGKDKTSQNWADPRRNLRIMVEAFSLQGGELDHRSFGFRAELMANLARFREWTLLEDAVESDAHAGSGAASDKGTQSGNDPADYIMKGVGLSADQIQISLARTASDKVVWSKTINLGLDNWHQEQLRVISDIAATLEIYISKDRLVSTLKGGEATSSSLDDWLRAEFLLAHWTRTSETQGQALLRQLIKKDPSFAPAHASLASIFNVDHIIHPGRQRDDKRIKAGMQLSRRAVELDAMDARNHLALAWSLALSERWDQALVHLDLVVQLNPNSPKAMISAAMGYCFFGDRYKAAQLARQGMSVAKILPGYLWCYIATVLYFANDYETVLLATEKAEDAIIDNQGWRAAAFAAMGRPNEARACFKRMVQSVSESWHGDEEPSLSSVLAWFLNAYPIREERTRRRLTQPLEGALRGL